MLKPRSRSMASFVDSEVELSSIRAPNLRLPPKLRASTGMALLAAGFSPGLIFLGLEWMGVNWRSSIDLWGPFLLMVWPIFLALTAKLCAKRLAFEIQKTEQEWRQPLITARSKIAAMQVVQRARDQRPEGWPDDWPRDNIS